MFNLFKKAEEISAKNFLEIKDKETVLDVRETDEPTSEEMALFPFYKLMPLSTLESSYKDLDMGTHYYILCRSGGRATKAYHFLKDKGYKVTVISGGIIDIKKAL